MHTDVVIHGADTARFKVQTSSIKHLIACAKVFFFENSWEVHPQNCQLSCLKSIFPVLKAVLPFLKFHGIR